VLFTELLRAGSLISGVCATVLAGTTVALGFDATEQSVVVFAAIWWLICGTAAMLVIGRRDGRPSDALERLLVDAKPQRIPDEPQVARVVVGRLWPLALVTGLTVLGGAVLGPRIPGVVVGFPLMWALQWRAQQFAVSAVEERDGVVFSVVPTGPLQPITLVRGPGLRREYPVDPSGSSPAAR
jgi:hypothetical protein